MRINIFEPHLTIIRGGQHLNLMQKNCRHCKPRIAGGSLESVAVSIYLTKAITR